jgi:tetratricopeptide (TPR) repeat protein
MKPITVAVVIVFVFVIASRAGTLRGQERLDAIIRCSGDSQDVLDILTGDDNGGAWRRGEKLLGFCFEDIITRIKSNLEVYNIDLTILQDSTDPQLNIMPLIDMYTSMSVHGAATVKLSFLRNPEAISAIPFLEAHPSSELELYVVTLEGKIAAADFVTGVLLYILGECELAMPFLNTTTATDFYWYTYTDSGKDFFPQVYAQFYKGNCATLDEDYQIAIHHFETDFSPNAKDIALRSIELQANLAGSYLKLGSTQRALEVMHSAVEMAQGLNNNALEVKARMKRAELYALVSDNDAALADIDYTIHIDPTNPVLYTLRGQFYINQYEWDRALADFDTALTLDPAHAPAYFQRGLLRYSVLQTGVALHDEALIDFQRYLELAPDGEYAAQATAYITQIAAARAALEG